MIVAFNYKFITKPVLQINDTGNNQVVIRFIPYADEHLTIHLQQNSILLLTHRSDDKEKSIWDDDRVDIASRLGYANPDRHG